MSNELKVLLQSDVMWNPWYREYYYRSDVDKVIAEKDAQILDLIEQVQKERSAKVDYKISANDLSDGLKKTYEEIRRLRRALYKACAMWAQSEIRRRFGGYPHEGNGWFKMKTKCRAKAEEYK